MTTAHGYPDKLGVEQARARFFADNGFSEAAYTDRWVRLRIGPLYLGFPNTRSRQRAVKLHDLHHVATGYATNWTGEAEISAWELAAGCHGHLAAWALDFSGFAIGLVIAPRNTYRAFVRGLRSLTLYDHPEFDPAMLKQSVGELRASLNLDDGLHDAHPTSWRERLSFAGAVAAVGLTALAPLALGAALISLIWL